MKKYSIFIIIFCIFFLTPAYSKSIKKTSKKVTVKTVKPQRYTVANAKSDAFKDVKTYLPLVYYRADLTDRYYDVNMSYLEKQVNSPYDNSRIILPTYLGTTLISYGVRYSDKSDKIYYYNSRGKLTRIEFDNNNPDSFPKRTVTYNNKGNLHSVVLYISKSEQYNFDGNGNLIVHWIGERGFNRLGQPLKIRRSL